MEITATSKYIRISPRKTRLVAAAVSRLPLDKALAHLSLLNKKAALPVRKTMLSAISNAENTAHLKREELAIKAIKVDEGPALKRWRSKARGIAHEYKRRTSHIKVILEKVKAQSKKRKNESMKRASRTKVKRATLARKK